MEGTAIGPVGRMVRGRREGGVIGTDGSSVSVDFGADVAVSGCCETSWMEPEQAG